MTHSLYFLIIILYYVIIQSYSKHILGNNIKNVDKKRNI